MVVTFLGAAETVTGSRFLVEHAGTRILVDCGLFQGLKALRLLNWDPLPVEARSIDAVVLTHAHIDHSGFIPRLYRDGFRGPVLCTEATRELCGVLLPDSGFLQEEEAGWLNRTRRTRHQPALPLYTQADAEACLPLLRPVPYDQPQPLGKDLSVTLRPTGHIIGAAMAYLQGGGRTLAFTGDVGRPSDPVMRPPAPMEPVDYLVCESTYGDRRHAAQDPREQLRDAIRETYARGGTVLIPAFAVGRAQTVLHLLAELRISGEIPDLPVYVNSPMAVRATRIFTDHPDEHRLSPAQVDQLDDGVRFVRSAEESKELVRRKEPMIVISASGMATGGRILHHLKTALPDPRNTVLFVGYQAAGTRGESLVHGAEQVKIHGDYVPVRARIARLDGLSVHADFAELCDWLRPIPQPRRTFLVHGEPAAQDALRRYLKDLLGWEAEIPRMGARVELG